MKNIISKKVVGALVLAAAGLPLATQAATTANVAISATIAEKLEVTATPNVNFTGDTTKQDIEIKTTHNTGPTTYISVSGADIAADGKFKLQLEDTPTTTLSVKASITGSTTGLKKELGANAKDATTKLNLELLPSDTQAAGIYKGTLTITISSD